MARPSPQTPDVEAFPPLTLSPEKACFVIVKAREFDAKEETDEESGSNPADEAEYGVLTERADDAVEFELGSFIEALTEDEQVDLVALAWLGRDGGSVADWTDVRREAAEAHNDRTAAYLLGIPLLADFIEEGLNILGVSCDEFEMGRL
jgi:hypothetical protein